MMHSGLKLLAAAAFSLSAVTAGSAGERAIRIGILGDQSGQFADLGGPGSIIAAKMAAEQFGNAINGKPIEILAADMQNKPDVASSIARRWFDIEQVDVIADLPLTSVAFAVQEIARTNKKVLLINAAAAAELTGKACSPYTIHWQDDSRALSIGTAQAVLASGLKRWFFLTPDYAWGNLMEAAATATIKENGGTVVGTAKFPLGTSDYSSQLLAASASKAQVFAAGTVGHDTLNLLKQASEFQLVRGDAKIVVFQMFLTETHGLGLAQARGLFVSDGFYWDKNDATRAWSKEFMKRHGKMPTKSQAYLYLSVMHYLKAVKAAGADDAATVSKTMKSMPADNFGDEVRIRANGRVMYDMALYEVKTPEESKYPWDYYRLVRTIPAKDAFGGADTDDCPPR